MSVSGFEPSIFVVRPHDKFFCPICLNILRDPGQCSSGHSFCCTCLKSLPSERKICPMCREDIDMNKICKNLIVKEIINEMLTFCPSCDSVADDKSIACTWTGELHKRDWHYYNECVHRLIVCPNNCGEFVKKLLVDAHVTSVCKVTKKMNKRKRKQNNGGVNSVPADDNNDGGDLTATEISSNVVEEDSRNIDNATAAEIIDETPTTIVHQQSTTNRHKYVFLSPTLMLLVGCIIGFILVFSLSLTDMTVNNSDSTTFIADYAIGDNLINMVKSDDVAIGFVTNNPYATYDDTSIVWTDDRDSILAEILELDKVLVEKRAFIDYNTPNVILDWFINYFQMDSMTMILKNIESAPHATNYKSYVHFAVDFKWSDVITSTIFYYGNDNTVNYAISFQKTNDKFMLVVDRRGLPSFDCFYTLYGARDDIPTMAFVGRNRRLPPDNISLRLLEAFVVDDVLRVLITVLTHK